MKTFPAILLLVYLLVGCSGNAPYTTCVIFDPDDYEYLSYQKLGDLLTSGYLTVRISDGIKEDPELSKSLIGHLEKDGSDDLLIARVIRGVYSVQEHERHSLYQVTFLVDDEEVEFLLIKLLKDVLRNYNAALRPVSMSRPVDMGKGPPKK